MEISTSVKEEVNKVPKTILPEEVIVDIISRFPVRSVFQAQCLSKNFSFITKDPHFVKVHLSNSARTRPSIIFNRFNHLDLIRCSSELSDFTAQEIPLHQDFQFSNGLELVASCNGLIITVDKDIDNCFVWNPITNQCNRLPSFSSVPDGKHVRFSWGFGYCTESEVYKIVRIASVYLMDGNSFKYIKGAEVLSCGIDQSWRRLDPGEIGMRFESGITIEGVVYWEDGESRLLAFDLAKEEFSRISVPVGMDRTIMNFKGSLAICHWSEMGRNLDLWIMKDEHFASDGLCCFIDGNSWEKIYSITELPIYIRFSLCLNDGQLFLIHDKCGEGSISCLYDLERKAIKHIPRTCIGGLFEVCTFVESLVDPSFPSQSTSSYAGKG